MRNVRVFLSTAALANLSVTLWHLYLAVEMHPGVLGTAPVRIAIQTGALTLVGVALLWTRYPKIGSLVLLVVLALGFVMGCLEHFFVAGPYNVFDVGSGHWVLPFDISVALLAVFQVAGLSAAVRMLAALKSSG
jgi:hypothetical protein